MSDPAQPKMILTEMDIIAIAQKVDEIHKCRYDIEPDRLARVFDFVESFYDGAMETKRAVRTATIRVVVWGTIGAVLVWLGMRFPAIRSIMRFLSGN